MTSRVDQLLENYRRHVGLQPQSTAASAKRVWFAVYPPEDERRVMSRLGEFELATKDAQLNWCSITIKGQFADWLDSFPQDEREACFSQPEVLETYARSDFKARLIAHVRAEMAKAPEPSRTVFALSGLLELFNYLHVSDIVSEIESSFPGFLLVLFPGEREGNVYRFLRARDGWNYLAIPIVSDR